MRGIHPKISKLLFHRFLYATWKCYHLEYQLLFLFLLFIRFDIQHPVKYVQDVFYWSLYSVFTWTRLFLLTLMAVSYGLILCNIHQRPPIRHCSWLEIVIQELPLKMGLLTVLINLCYGNICIYISYLRKMDLDLNDSLTSRYLMVSGLSCGLFHFFKEHCSLDREIWPLPLMHLSGTKIQYWLTWPTIWLGLHKSVIPMLPLVIFDWPSWQVLGQACCLSILITAKLNNIKCIYGNFMHRKLPLTLRTELKYQRQELELPLILALSTTSLHGFQLQVAKDFYDMANHRNKPWRHRFKLHQHDHIHKDNWRIVRDILMARIKYFMRQLDYCLAVNNDPIVYVKPAKDYSKMRPLMRSSAEPQRYYSCRQHDLPKKPFYPPRTATPESGLCFCLRKLLTKLKVICRSNLWNWTSQNYLEHTLHCNLSISWLVQGLVSICLRSLKEDKCGLVQTDLGHIFQQLLDLEKLLCSVKKYQKVKSSNLTVLLLATSSSINMLKYHFNPYLECIIEDEKLLMELQSRK